MGSPWTANTTLEALALSTISLPSSTNSLSTVTTFLPAAASRSATRVGDGGEVYRSK
jgi:hypothetical protein